jgi:acylphosphatase
MKKRVHVFYSGNVQGVGFRFTTVRIAAETGVPGWVRNLGDGRVEVIAEGNEEKLLEFLEKMRTGSMRHYIRAEDIDWQEYTGEYKSFDVTF